MDTTKLQQIKLSDISISGTNPRKHFDEKELKELCTSLETHGVLQPIVLRTVKGKHPYELVAGERRYRAAKLAKFSVIPAIVTSMTDEEALEIQVIENLQRKDLSPMEEAESYESLISGKFKYTPESIAAKIGKSIGYIKSRLRLMNLAEEVREALHNGKIQLGHALVIAKIEGEDMQKSVLDKACNVWSGWTGDVITVDRLKKKIYEDLFIPLSKAPFKLSDDLLLPVAGSCSSCPFNTGNATDLFEDIKKGNGMCTKPSCFKDKNEAFYEQLRIKEEAKGNKVLTAKESSDVFGYGGNNGMSWNSPYSLTTDKCTDHPKKLPLNKLLKGKKIVEYIAFDNQNRVRRLYKNSEVVQVLKDEKWAKALVEKNANSRGGGSTSESVRNNRRHSLQQELTLKKIGAAILKKKFDPKLLHSVAIQRIEDDADEILKALGLPISNMDLDNDIKTIEAYYSKCSADDKLKVDTLIVALSGWLGHDLLTTELKIDEKVIKSEAKKLEAIEWKEKKKSPKKTAKGKGNPTAATLEREEDDEEIEDEE